MPVFLYHGQIIEYTLTRNAKRNINFRVKNTGEIHISAPKRVSQKELNQMIEERADWLIRNRNKILTQKHSQPPSTIQNDTVVYLNGKPYTIHILPRNKQSNSDSRKPN